MKKLLLSACLLFGGLGMYAETITAHYYGSEIDLSQKNNPCKGKTDGGVEVIVVTNVSADENIPTKTIVERTYKLPNGEVLKTEKKIVDSPKAVVLHKLFPRQYPKVKY